MIFRRVQNSLCWVEVGGQQWGLSQEWILLIPSGGINAPPLCEWNIQTMHISQKVILLQLAIGNMVLKVVCKCLDFNPPNNPVMIGIIVPILQAVNSYRQLIDDRNEK